MANGDLDNEKSPVVGIDLGTCNSCLASWNGREAQIWNDNLTGLPTIPSVIYHSEKTNWLTGAQAVQRASADPQNGVLYIKRQMDDPDFRVTLAEKEYSPVDISARILEAVAHRTWQCRFPEGSGHEIAGAVITVPYYFNSLQRKNTETAGDQAGLNVLSIINEPTAASIAYAFQGNVGIFQSEPQKIMVFDLGGGTFDITIFEVSDQPDQYQFRVLATGGDYHLGGTDFDEELLRFTVEHFQKESGIDLFTFEPEMDRLRYLSIVRQGVINAKHDMASMDSTFVMVPNLPKGAIELDISREEMKNLITGWLDRIASITEDTMERARLRRTDLNRVVMVGGSTKLPYIKPLLQELASQEPYLDSEVDTTVARGAAYYAAFVSKPQRWQGLKPIEIIDVNSQALGVATSKGEFEVLIGADVPLPFECMKQFMPSEDNASSFEVDVYQGSNLKDVSRNDKIGSIPVRDIPPRPRDEIDIDILFRLDKNNICTVKVTVKGKDFEPITVEKPLQQ